LRPARAAPPRVRRQRGRTGPPRRGLRRRGLAGPGDPHRPPRRGRRVPRRRRPDPHAPLDQRPGRPAGRRRLRALVPHRPGHQPRPRRRLHARRLPRRPPGPHRGPRRLRTRHPPLRQPQPEPRRRGRRHPLPRHRRGPGPPQHPPALPAHPPLPTPQAGPLVPHPAGFPGALTPDPVRARAVRAWGASPTASARSCAGPVAHGPERGGVREDGGMPNRLAQATSPYLLQHADNPVDWWPWEAGAFEEARRRDVPVLLSVGYSACHWCHVMAHESFEDQETADYLNAHFVSVKVDREERPDVDAVYMEAVQAATGHGGWPMTVFLTPDAEPFYFGTYFPPEPRQGMPSFRQVLQGVHQAWQERRDEVADVAGKIAADLAGREIAFGDAQVPGEQELAQALLGLTRDYDPKRGGFGGAPKFPPSMVLEFLLRHHARTGAEGALQMAADTCERMARGGIYDQLGGGFARYSVDRDWKIPHFEKMLYDNALLCRVYAHLWRSTRSELAGRVASETAGFMVGELRTPEGGFASALDADSDDGTGRHAEGAYYVWTPAQLREVLGEADAELAARYFGVTEEGTFEEGASVLQLP